MELDGLRGVVEAWERGVMPSDDYLFGLIYRHLPLLQEILKDAPKTKKMSSGLNEEQLQKWINYLDNIKLDLDLVSELEGLIKVHTALRNILALVQKSDLNKNASLIARIVEEITSWNRKKLTEEEFTRLRTEVEVIRQCGYLVDQKDYDWMPVPKQDLGI